MSVRTYLLQMQVVVWVILAAVGGLIFQSVQKNAHHTHLADLTRANSVQLEVVLKSIIDLETGTRGYVITGQETFLEPYTAARERLPGEIGELRSSEQRLQRVGNDSHLRQIDRIHLLLQQWLVTVAEPQIAARQRSLEEAQRLVSSGRGKRITDEIRAIHADYKKDERQELLKREQAAAASLREVQVLTIIGVLAAILASVLASLTVAGRLSCAFEALADATEKLVTGKKHQNIPESRIKEAARLARNFNSMARQLRVAHETLEEHNSELVRQNREISALGEVTDLLQSCRTLDEGYRVLTATAPKLLPGTSGAIALQNSSRNLLETKVTWNETHGSELEVFTPDDCWALRRGRSILPAGQQFGQVCSHITGSEPHLCIPLSSQGDTIGLLRASITDSGANVEQVSAYAQSIANQVALALGNLRLREKLNNLSIRDPLTGLYNRRYLEETFERELRRCERHAQPLSVLVFDIDHFKLFNDTFGHDAGDAVLLAVGRTVQEYFRREDIACRYGGEEFLIILPQATLDQAWQRAEELRARFKMLQLTHAGRDLGRVTFSAGIAAFSEHGREPDELIQRADQALYTAKRSGRNRTLVYQHAPENPSST